MSRSVILSVQSVHDMQNKIVAIKAVRGLTGLGLKESKELVERVNPGHQEVLHVVSSLLEPYFSEHVRALNDNGMRARPVITNSAVRNGIADEIRKLITYTTMAAQYDISKALLDVMQTYCPQPSDEFVEELDE